MSSASTRATPPLPACASSRVIAPCPDSTVAGAALRFLGAQLGEQRLHVARTACATLQPSEALLLQAQSIAARRLHQQAIELQIQLQGQLGHTCPSIPARLGPRPPT